MNDWRLVHNVTEIRRVCRGSRGAIYMRFCTPQTARIADIVVSCAAIVEVYRSGEAGDLYYRFDGGLPLFYFEAGDRDDDSGDMGLEGTTDAVHR